MTRSAQSTPVKKVVKKTEKKSAAPRDDHFTEGEISIYLSYPGMGATTTAQGGGFLPLCRRPALSAEVVRELVTLAQGEGAPIQTGDNYVIQFKDISAVLTAIVERLTQRRKPYPHRADQPSPVVAALWGRMWDNMGQTAGTAICPVRPVFTLDMQKEIDGLQENFLSTVKHEPDLLKAPPPILQVAKGLTDLNQEASVRFVLKETRRYSYTGVWHITVPMAWKFDEVGVDAALVETLCTGWESGFLAQDSAQRSPEVLARRWRSLLRNQTGFSAYTLNLLTYWHGEKAEALRTYLKPQLDDAQRQVARQNLSFRCGGFPPGVIDSLAEAIANRLGLPPRSVSPAELSPGTTIDLYRAINGGIEPMISWDADAQANALAPTGKNLELVGAILNDMALTIHPTVS